MTRTDLISAVADINNLPKSVVKTIIVDTLIIIQQQLARGGKVQLVGFGTFDVKTRAPRKGINPRTGDVIDLPESKLPYFKAGKPLKEVVRNADRRR